MKCNPSNLQHEPQNSNRPVDEASQVGHESHRFRPRLDERVAQRTAELLTRVTASITLSGEPGT
jgi:hypothetical protein